MKLLAIDSSSNIAGWAILESLPENQAQLLSSGEIKLKAGKLVNYDGLLILFNELNKIIKEYLPTVAVIESAYGGINLKTYGKLSNYIGVATLACLVNNISNINEINASSARKRLFSNGKIKKEDACSKISTYYKQSLATKGFDRSDAIILGTAFLGVSIQ